MKIKFIALFLIILGISLVEANAQDKGKPQFYHKELNVDSIAKQISDPLYVFPQVNIYPQKVFKNARERRRYDKLVNNFKKVYPYVLELSATYNNIEDSLKNFPNEKNREVYVKLREKQLMKYYRPILSRFTLSQGVLMVKLLNRESGSTAYEIIKELKGNVNAFFWQTFAVLFGNNLKREYDAAGKDYDIEILVMRYHDGFL